MGNKLSKDFPNPFTLFPDRAALLTQTTQVLSESLSQTPPNTERVSDFLGATPGADFLLARLPELRNETPMTILRKAYQAGISLQPTNELPIVGTEKRNPLETTLPPNLESKKVEPKTVKPKKQVIFAFNGDPNRPVEVADLSAIPESATRVHIGAQKFANMDDISNLVFLFPKIKTICFIPSFRRLVTREMEEFLRRLGVELTYGRIKEVPVYNRGACPKGYEDQKRFFEKIGACEDTKKVYDLMLKDKAPEVLIAQEYFSNWRAIRKIAEDLGINTRIADAYFSTFKKIFGFGKDSPVIDKNSLIVKHLLDKERAEQEVLAAQTRRKSAAVGDIMPPIGLPESRWKVWQQIVKLQLEQPEKIEYLIKTSKSKFLALSLYYGLEPNKDSKVEELTQQQIADKEHLTRQAINWRSKQALIILGIDKES